MNRPTRMTLTLVALVVALIVAGCGGGHHGARFAVTPDRLSGHRPTLAPPANSVVKNGSFETAEELAPYTGGSWEATFTRVEQAGAPDGKWVAQASSKGGTAAYWSFGWWPTATSTGIAGKYQALVYVRAANATSVGKSIRLAIREKSGSTAVQTVEGGVATLTNAWQALVVEATIKAAGDHVDVFATTSGAGGSIYVDSVQLVPVEAQTVPITNAPCKVTLEAKEREGACSGTFTPKGIEPPPPPPTTETTPSTETTPPPPPPSGASVPAKPYGPSGEYHVVFADGFGTSIGTGSGQDSFWKANTHTQGCCSNSNEIAAEHPNKVRVGANGLELLCARESVEGKSFDCGGIDTATTNGFSWKVGGGQTFAFEIKTRWPPQDGGEDPGWWATDNVWTDEIDYFEGWGYGGHVEYYAGIPCWLPKAGAGSDICHEIYKAKSEIPNPETELHTYTTVVKPNNELEEWIDGKYRWNDGPVSGPNTPQMHLIISHALRVASNIAAGTPSVWLVRSAAAYEIGSGNTTGGGTAPGTVVR